ncbi:hypothetical protein CEJ42_18840 [Herbaspirillum robiniae]|uniref:Uncharacterized protein n=1 Tax=Herbaspirillum robiniae TaxID=2014887 RepID=A0A246WPV6_9BURK|nr:hypothetical protein CEJ42_18840 [Herbaspirillum robiniae]
MNTVLSLLNQRGLRPTVARMQLLSALEGGGHERMTAEQIYMRIANDGASVSLATVYRVLKELSRYGLVERGWCQDGQEVRLLFSKRRAEMRDPEPEMFCVSCRRSMTVGMPALRAELNRLAVKHKLQPQDRAIVIHITCPACAKG